MSQVAQNDAQEDFEDVVDIVKNIKVHAPHLQLEDGYIEQVVTSLRAARCKYEAATLGEQNTTSHLLMAQVATLEVMGETHALSLPNAHYQIGKVKDKPCILCS